MSLVPRLMLPRALQPPSKSKLVTPRTPTEGEAQDARDENLLSPMMPFVFDAQAPVDPAEASFLLSTHTRQ